MVRVLLAHKADVTLQLQDGSTALIAACFGGYTEIVETILLHSEAKEKDEQQLQRLLGSSSVVGDGGELSKGGIRDTPLSSAESVVNHRYKQGSTALMSTTYKGFVDVAKMLVTHGIDVNATNAEGWSALTVASEKGCFKIAKLLLENGAHVDVCNKAGFTPLMYACKMGFSEIAEELIAHKATVNHVTWPAVVDVHTAPHTRHEAAHATESVPLSPAVSASAFSTLMDLIDGYLPPLMLAIASHDMNTVRLLLASGADKDINMSVVAPHMNKRDFASFMQENAESNTVEAEQGPNKQKTAKERQRREDRESRHIELILSELEGMGSIYDYFSTPVMFAVFTENKEALSLLLSGGADVNNAVNVDGDSAIVVAALIGNTKVTSLLLSHGAKLPLFSKDRGKTVRQLLYQLLKGRQLSLAAHLAVKYMTGGLVGHQEGVRSNKDKMD